MPTQLPSSHSRRLASKPEAAEDASADEPAGEADAEATEGGATEVEAGTRSASSSVLSMSAAAAAALSVRRQTLQRPSAPMTPTQAPSGQSLRFESKGVSSMARSPDRIVKVISRGPGAGPVPATRSRSPPAGASLL